MQESTAGPTTDNQVADAPVPTSIGGYLRGMGPGIVVALMWLGVGDLVDSSVAGANYGYALMWALAIALLARYFFTSAIAKYYLCNSQGDVSVIQGLGRLWRGFPLVVGVSSFILGFIYQTYFIKAAGTALWNLSGRIGPESWGIFVWAVIAVAFGAFMMSRAGAYRFIEIIARVAVIALILGFLVAMIRSGVNVAGFLEGLTFRTPPDVGAFSALLVAVALIGAVGGSSSNLLYPYFLQDKGWRGPRYRKLQIFDLLTGVVAIIFINVAVWAVAAETMQGAGLTVETPDDLATMMERAVGSFGPTMLWLALFFATFTTFPAQSHGYCKLLLDSVHQTYRARGERYGRPENDPSFRWLQYLVLLILPLILSLPFAPNVVVLTVIASGIAVLIAPIIIVGVILLTSNRNFMLPGYVNRWWQIIILLIVGGIGLWASYNLIRELLF